MKVINTKVVHLDYVNNVPQSRELQLEINAKYDMSISENSNECIGIITLILEDVNDDNDYPFTMNVTYQGILNFQIGEELEENSFQLLYNKLCEFIKNFTKDAGLDPLTLPKLELEISK